jgi:hypothetical protein
MVLASFGPSASSLTNDPAFVSARTNLLTSVINVSGAYSAYHQETSDVNAADAAVRHAHDQTEIVRQAALDAVNDELSDDARRSAENADETRENDAIIARLTAMIGAQTDARDAAVDLLPSMMHAIDDVRDERVATHRRIVTATDRLKEALATYEEEDPTLPLVITARAMHDATDLERLLVAYPEHESDTARLASSSIGTLTLPQERTEMHTQVQKFDFSSLSDVTFRDRTTTVVVPGFGTVSLIASAIDAGIADGAFRTKEWNHNEQSIGFRFADGRARSGSITVEIRGGHPVRCEGIESATTLNDGTFTLGFDQSCEFFMLLPANGATVLIRDFTIETKYEETSAPLRAATPDEFTEATAQELSAIASLQSWTLDGTPNRLTALREYGARVKDIRTAVDFLTGQVISAKSGGALPANLRHLPDALTQGIADLDGCDARYAAWCDECMALPWDRLSSASMASLFPERMKEGGLTMSIVNIGNGAVSIALRDPGVPVTLTLDGSTSVFGHRAPTQNGAMLLGTVVVDQALTRGTYVIHAKTSDGRILDSITVACDGTRLLLADDTTAFAPQTFLVDDGSMSLSALNDRAVADEVTNGFVAASYGERIDNAAGIGSVLTAVNMFDGVTNTAMMTTQSMEYSAFVRSMMPEIRHIEESELQGIFAANFPQWNPDRCDSVMKANRWDRYTYDVSRNGDYQTLTRAWYAYNEGLDMFIAKTMEAVGLMYSGSAAQANAALREIRDAFEGKSPMARFGVEYPSVNDMILCCAECIESDPSHVREMQSNGKDRRDAMQYHLDHDPNAAGTGDGEDNPPNPAEQARREKQYWDNFRDLQSTLIGESTRGVDVYGTVVALLGYDGGLAVIHDIMGRLSPSARAIVEEDLRRAGTALPMVDINQTSIPDLENVGLSADLIIQLRDALQYASPADLANLQNMIASAHDARQDGNELIALLQGDRVTSIDVVAGPAPSQLEREIDNEIVMDAVQDTSLFDETYGQTRDLLQLIQKGFQDTIDEYQFRLDNAAQAFLQGKNRSALEKAALAAEVLSTAAVKSALVGLKAAVPSTPEALLILIPMAMI